MFISNYEKNHLKMRIGSLEVAIARLENEINEMQSNQKTSRKPIFKTDEAPWGYKKDGIPRKRPGRKIKPMEVSS